MLSFLYFSSFAFVENYFFNEEDKPSQKLIIVDEELDHNYVDGIGHLEDLPELLRNPKVVD